MAAIVAALPLTMPLSGQRGAARRRASTFVRGHEASAGEVLIKYRTQASAGVRTLLETDTDADESEAVGRSGLRRLHSRRLRTEELIDRLSGHPDIEYVEPNYLVQATTTPNDPSFSVLWGLQNLGQNILGVTGTSGADIGAPAAWSVTTGSRSNVVGVIDTGIDYYHPDLAANIWSAPSAFSVVIGGVTINCAAGTHGFNAINKTCDPLDDHYHGTHVSGTIGAVGNNGTGVVGVNWTASIMGLKFLAPEPVPNHDRASGSISDAINAIEFAIQVKAVFAGSANVRVLSNSWGGGGFSQALLDEINRANTNDMLFVAAAGNDAINNDVYHTYPASYAAPNVVSVAALDNKDALAYFSSYGPASVHLGAPGVSVYSTAPSPNDFVALPADRVSYRYLDGTSMATPHVSGAAALILSACSLSTAQLKNALLTSVIPVASLATKTITGGRLNVARALGCRASVSADSVTPGSGSGTTQTFAAQFSDTAGAGDLNVANLWFTTSPTNSANSCLLYYAPATGRFNLMNDAGAAWTSGAAGASGALSNSACSLNLAASSAVSSGTTLTVNAAVTFTSAYAGAKNVYMYAANSTGVGTGWQNRGTWTAVGSSLTAPTLTWAAPASITYGTALSTTQLNATANVPGTFQYSPAAGTVLGGGAGQTLSVTFTPTDTAHYSSATTTTLITVLKATPTVTWATPASINAGTALSSTQLNATASVPGTFVYTPASGTFPAAGTVTLSVTFTPTATANYASVTKTVSLTVVAVTVSTVSVTPGSGSGASQLFVAQYADTAGASDIQAVNVWFVGSPAVFANSCFMTFEPGTSTLSLSNDAGTANLPGVTIGGSGTLQNSSCSIAVSGSSATLSGTTLTLSLAMTFKPAFAGAKSVYLGAANHNGGPLEVRGTWTVPATGAVVTADSVTPNTGTGATQTFALQYSDSLGGSNLNVANVWFTPSPTNSANSCLAYYSPATGNVNLLNDDGTVWTAAPVGATFTLQNSACSLSMSGSSVTVSGSTLTLNLAVTFTTAYAGAKNIYMYASSLGGVSTGWQNRGSWTAPGPRTIPTVTWSAPAAITYGTALSATQLNATASVSGTLAYTPGFGTVLGGGAGQVLSVTFTPTDTVTYAPVTATTLITVARATPTVTWATPASVIAGATLGSTQLNATANTGGTFAYSPPSGTLLSTPGTQTLSVTFTPTSTANYTTATKTVTLTVLTMPVASADSIAPSSGTGVTQTFTVQASNTAGAAALSRVDVWFTANVANYANACELMYVPSANTVSLLNDAGTVYTAGSLGGSGTVQNSRCTLALTGASAVISGKTVTLTLPLTFTQAFAGSKSVLLYAANAYGNSDWQTRGSWTVPDSRTAPTLTWATPADITYGTALSATQLNATANVAGTFSYNWGVGTVLPAGSGMVLLTQFTPTDTATYAPATISVLINILKATPVVTWAAPANIPVGTALGSAQLNATASVGGTFVYSPPAGTMLAAGTGQTLSVTFTPSSSNYAPVTQTTAITVVGSPTVTADSVAPSSGSGSTGIFRLQFSDTAGAADLTVANVWFTTAPTNSANSCLAYYAPATGMVSLLNDDATAWTPAPIGATFTLQNSACSLAMSSSSAVLSGNTLTLTLTVTFAPSYGGAKNVYMYAARAGGISTGWQNRGAWTIPGGTQTTPTVTWAAPAGISYGTPLSATQLNATANVAGTFQYTPAAGTVLPVGSAQVLSVTFTPTDTLHYTTATATTPITVSRATPAITWAAPGNITAGTALSVTQLNATSSVPGTFVYTPPAGTVLSAGAGQTLSVTLTPTDAVNYATATRAVLITVVAAGAAVTADSATPNSGSGASQLFALQYSDTAGAMDLNVANVWFTPSPTDSAHSCLAYYAPASGLINLLNDEGSAWMSGPVGGSGTLNNSACSVALGGSSVVTSGNTLTLNLALTFAPAFAGAKNIYMYAANAGGISTGWQNRGAWTVTSGGSAPVVTAGTATPSAGTGTSQTFSLQFADTAGAADLSVANVWFTTNPTNGANSCLAYYVPGSGMVNLLNDSGSAWMSAPIGGGATLQNSACALALGASSATSSGNTLTLTLAVTFAPGFSGPKTTLLYAASGAGVSTGWQVRGSWTVP